MGTTRRKEELCPRSVGSYDRNHTGDIQEPELCTVGEGSGDGTRRMYESEGCDGRETLIDFQCMGRVNMKTFS